MLVRNLTVLVCVGCLLSFGSPRTAASGSVAPLPIPGGDVIPCPCTGQASGSLLIHQFLPGSGFDGQDAEPNGIKNFNGIIFPRTNDPLSPFNWAGTVWDATATGSFSFRYDDGSYSAQGTTDSALPTHQLEQYGTMGHERNGFFVQLP